MIHLTRCHGTAAIYKPEASGTGKLHDDFCSCLILCLTGSCLRGRGEWGGGWWRWCWDEEAALGRAFPGKSSVLCSTEQPPTMCGWVWKCGALALGFLKSAALGTAAQGLCPLKASFAFRSSLSHCCNSSSFPVTSWDSYGRDRGWDGAADGQPGCVLQRQLAATLGSVCCSDSFCWISTQAGRNQTTP